MKKLTQINLRYILSALALLSLPLLFSCEDIVEVDTPAAEPVLNIDAWLDSKPTTQTVRLSFTQPYFDNDNFPPAASGATVTVTDGSGNTYNFEEGEAGTYQWTPKGNQKLGATGQSYTLSVNYQGETFTSSCNAGRVPAIDSITFRYQEAGFNQAGYRAEFWARDPAGLNDTYWVKTYKNGRLLNEPDDINVAYDGGENPGASFDGEVFIIPVRGRINADERDENGNELPALIPGDSIYVEIHSLTVTSFNYMRQLIAQIDRQGGLGEIFNSPPQANVSTNIINANPSGSQAVGFFNVAVVSGLGARFDLQQE
ncbi:DUF4249 domain-containing protein [Dyadobacter sp. CY261]|uniref:DUF4249 domain-containing protein n=1 Tax=Dyadobacter sp. CY261 TaxID=2907203 RepID=UPI001F3DD34E|nr:DUF4249 domain-containing protein [Dyadobacter sp. CY261]MCF0075296.1 DUF4249 domain-containing protein [Dyadobacter sp. CY261]